MFPLWGRGIHTTHFWRHLKGYLYQQREFVPISCWLRLLKGTWHWWLKPLWAEEGRRWMGRSSGTWVGLSTEVVGPGCLLEQWRAAWEFRLGRCQVGCSKVVSLEGRSLWRRTECPGNIPEWLLFISLCQKHLKICLWSSQWEAGEAREGKILRNVGSLLMLGLR